METKDYLRLLRDRIHTTVMATLDSSGRPITRAVDIMLADDETLYFLTARGKEFYDQLMEQQYVAFTGMLGGEGLGPEEATLHKTAISIRGSIENIGSEKLAECFAENPYMESIYPQPHSRRALEVFRVTEGVGEFFEIAADGSVTRTSFTLGTGSESPQTGGFIITDACVGCGACLEICPHNCIDDSRTPPVIRQEHCIHCGNCASECPVGAIVRR